MIRSHFFFKWLSPYKDFPLYMLDFPQMRWTNSKQEIAYENLSYT